MSKLAPLVLSLLLLSNLSAAASIPSVKRAEGFPVSAADRNAVLCGIKTYGDPALWPDSQLDIVQDTLELELENYVPQPATPTTTSTNAACTVTSYAQVASAVAACTDLHIRDLNVPPNTTLDLSKVNANTVVTFEGRTFWEFGNSSYDLLKIGGTNITVQGAACSVLDGNGLAWWDGIGSNGGVPKPDHMVTGSKLIGNSVIKNLYIKNAPTHVFSISGAFGLVMKAIVIDMKQGYTLLSNGLQAAHNTDGFDIASSTDMLLTNNVVFNQDDCVAITSGGGLVTTNMYCSGGHGLSIGSIGGKSNNTVDGVIFSNSKVINSQTGARIKCNSGTTGLVNNVTYDGIQVSNASIYGIDIQQDYLNGGPTGIPTAGVNITNIVMHNIHGTAQPGAENYYLLTAPGTTTATWTFSDIDITGGYNSTCLIHPAGLNC